MDLASDFSLLGDGMSGFDASGPMLGDLFPFDAPTEQVPDFWSQGWLNDVGFSAGNATTAMDSSAVPAIASDGNMAASMGVSTAQNDLDFGLHGWATASPQPLSPQKRTRTVTVDVSKMINELIQRGICLGRAPGFRKRDVDMAVARSIVSAY